MILRSPLRALLNLLAVAGLGGAEPPQQPLPLPTPGSLAGLGVNIHFTAAQPGELDQLSAGGYRLVRMDFAWEGIEQQQGVYDFSAYDRLLADLDQHHLRAYFILDYRNRFYDGGESPRSDAGRAAFCAFAAAALRHFAGRGVVWEMYNEPNISFWKPTPNVDDYAALALAVGAAVRQAAPHEIYVGPATSEIDMRFVERCFAAGCLKYWDAVSVHPYRHRPPETAAGDYRALRQLIARYAPRDEDGQPKAIPLLSGEWGYSSAGWGKGYDEALQGRYLPRQWLVNLANDVLISVWYDWHEDGSDENEGENHFGSVRFPYRAGQGEVYQPKPAYLAARTLTGELRGMHFDKALALGEDEHVLLFAGDGGQRLVAWSSAPSGSTVVVPASAGRFRAVGHLGEDRGMLTAGADGLTLALSQDPLYLAPEGANESLRLAAAWQRLPLDIAVVAPGEARSEVRFTNPLDRPLAVSFGGAATTVAPGMGASGTVRQTIGEREEVTRTLALAIDGRTVWTQATRVVLRNPLDAALLGVRDHDGRYELEVSIRNPAATPFIGTVALTEATGLVPARPAVEVAIRAGVREQAVRIPLAGAPASSYHAGLLLRDASGDSWRTLIPHSFRGLGDLDADNGAAWSVLKDGDAKVEAMASMSTVGRWEPPGSDNIDHALVLKYSFAKGWKFLRVAPARELTLPGRPSALALWVRSDGSGNLVRMRMVDSGGQTFQCDAGRLSDPGWQYRTFAIDATTAHWGGADDGTVHYPLRLDTLLLLDHGDQARESAGTVALAAPTLIE